MSSRNAGEGAPLHGIGVSGVRSGRGTGGGGGIGSANLGLATALAACMFSDLALRRSSYAWPVRIPVSSCMRRLIGLNGLSAGATVPDAPVSIVSATLITLPEGRWRLSKVSS